MPASTAQADAQLRGGRSSRSADRGFTILPKHNLQKIKVVNQPVGFRTFHLGTRSIQVRNT
jgi:hypothetical protein